MNIQLQLVPAKPIQYVKIDHKLGPVSIVVNPTAATYRACYTCTPRSVQSKVWVPITALYDKSDLQSAETGSATQLKFELVSGTSATVDVAQAEWR